MEEPFKLDASVILGDCLTRIEKELKEISASLGRSADSAEATHALYKKANNQTVMAMQAREERERASAARDFEQHEMNRQRHEAFMKTEAVKLKREEEWSATVKMASRERAVTEKDPSSIITP